MPLSHFIPAYPSPSPCPQVHSLRLHLYSCPGPKFFRTIIFWFFRFHICVLAYGICFSLSDLLHSVRQTLGESSMFLIYNIQLCECTPVFIILNYFLIYECLTFFSQDFAFESTDLETSLYMSHGAHGK